MHPPMFPREAAPRNAAGASPAPLTLGGRPRIVGASPPAVPVLGTDERIIDTQPGAETSPASEPRTYRGLSLYPFQLQAIRAIDEGRSVIVSAVMVSAVLVRCSAMK